MALIKSNSAYSSSSTEINNSVVYLRQALWVGNHTYMRHKLPYCGNSVSYTKYVNEILINTKYNWGPDCCLYFTVIIYMVNAKKYIVWPEIYWLP